MKLILHKSCIMLIILSLFFNQFILAQTSLIQVGSVAPEINLPDSKNVNISLNSLKGNMVLLNFWTSGDMLSRSQNQNLSLLNEKYKSTNFGMGKSFKVYNVSYDSNKDEWNKAITTDNLRNILNVNDVYTKSALLYQLNKLPTSFLIDENGVIVGKDMAIAQIEQALNQRLVDANKQVAASQQNVPGVYDYAPQTGAINNSAANIYAPTSTVTNTNIYAPSPPVYSTPTNSVPYYNPAPTVAQEVNKITQYTPAPTVSTTPAPAAVVPATASNTPAPAVVMPSVNTGEILKIQICAAKNLNTAEYHEYAKYGKITQETAANGFKRAVIGDFSDGASALKVLTAIKTKYPGAFVSLYRGSERIRTMKDEEVSQWTSATFNPKATPIIAEPALASTSPSPSTYNTTTANAPVTYNTESPLTVKATYAAYTPSSSAVSYQNMSGSTAINTDVKTFDQVSGPVKTVYVAPPYNSNTNLYDPSPMYTNTGNTPPSNQNNNSYNWVDVNQKPTIYDAPYVTIPAGSTNKTDFSLYPPTSTSTTTITPAKDYRQATTAKDINTTPNKSTTSTTSNNASTNIYSTITPTLKEPTNNFPLGYKAPQANVNTTNELDKAIDNYFDNIDYSRGDRAKTQKLTWKEKRAAKKAKKNTAGKSKKK